MESTIRRIRKLLNLADESSGTSQAEMNTAAQAAMKLMLKHGLSESDLASDDDLVGDNRELAVKIGAGSRAPTWKWNLAWVVADSANAKPYQFYLYGESSRDLCIGFIGRRSDAQLAGYVYRYLLAEIDRFRSESLPSVGSRIQQYVPGQPVEIVGRSFQRRWSKDFYLGAVSVLHQRMVEVKQETYAEADASALVHVDTISHQVDQVVEGLGISYESRSEVEVRSHTGLEAGMDAGRRIDLSRDHASLREGQRALTKKPNEGGGR